MFDEPICAPKEAAWDRLRAGKEVHIFGTSKWPAPCNTKSGREDVNASLLNTFTTEDKVMISPQSESSEWISTHEHVYLGG